MMRNPKRCNRVLFTMFFLIGLAQLAPALVFGHPEAPPRNFTNSLGMEFMLVPKGKAREAALELAERIAANSTATVQPGSRAGSEARYSSRASS